MADAENLAQWRGKQLIDRDGDKIGKLEEVYVDTETDEQLFATVKEGVLGKHLTFVLLRGATAGPDELKVATSKEAVSDAPDLDTDGQELSADEEAALYRHYGLDYQPPATPSGRRLARR